ncbi:hypothetical protein AVEN_72975-1 [Araneus ventricosus]|uniref:Tc1-like transposase DDE domain-containing protein n=1 Tax=Araneus ventricosus TaxID=182803 RepID=A0A4Y2QQ90_ARAVE|nr:hypothetical protein AVEN_72975-1 [Araneus ventricosus]
MVASSCMKIPKTQELLRTFKWEVWSQPPYSPNFAPNLGSKYLSGTSFSSESDVQTVVENCSMDRTDFCQVGVNKMELRSDKCLNIFADFVEQ